MDSVLSRADASANKSLAYLDVSFQMSGLEFHRIVEPVGNATIAEIVAAMQDDTHFANPGVESGNLYEYPTTKEPVLVGQYSLDGCAGISDAEIVEVIAYFEDETCEHVSL